MRCARLRPYNHRSGDLCRSYTCPSGLQLQAGWEETPSPVHIVENDKDWKILQGHPQVETFHVADIGALQSRLATEATDRALSTGTVGMAPVRDLPLAPVVGPVPVIGVDDVEEDDIEEDVEEEHVEAQMEIPSKFTPAPTVKAPEKKPSKSRRKR